MVRGGHFTRQHAAILQPVSGWNGNE